MRGKQAKKRKIEADPRYNSLVIAKFINYIMRSGKKTVAQKVVYKALELVEEKVKKDPLDVFDQVIKNVSPLLEVKSRRIGGANYQVPIQVRAERRLTLAFRWIIEAAKSKKGKPMSERLAMELIDAYGKQGAAIKKREDVHRMAEANRAFAHFARFSR
jgi:small subunit ribosomal protein S7